MPDMEQKRIYQFDIIKFLLSIIIVFHHFQQFFPYDGCMFRFYGGDIKFDGAVEMFFIISGILTSLSEEKNLNSSFANFFGKKFMRVFPMTAVSIVAFVVVAYVYNLLSGEILFGYCILSVWDFLACAFMIASGGALNGGWPIYNSPTWYIDVLLICYIVYYICLWLSRKWEVSRQGMFTGMIFVGMGVISYETDLPFLNMFTGRGYISFFTGVMLVYVYRWIKQRKMEKAVTVVSCGIVIFFLLIMVTGKFYLIEVNQQIVFALTLFPAILWLTLTKAGNILLNHKINKFFGGLSFQIYLWHCVLIGILQCVITRKTIIMNDITMVLFALALILFSIPMYGIETVIKRKLYSRVQD